MAAMKTLLILALVAAAAACRRDEITVRREPKEKSPDMAALAPATRPHGVRWTAPHGWSERPGTDMRVATLIPPAAHGKAEASVAAFPGDVGGELANVNRWRGQVALPPMTEADLPDARKTVRCRLGQVLVYDFTGAGARPSRLVAGMIKVGGATWFFKLSGDADAVAADKPAFLELLQGLTNDAS